MPLAGSGTMSLGGSTTTRSVNLELGRTATAQISFNEAAVRSLAGISSGAISMSSFYGKASTITPVGVTTAGAPIFYGFNASTDSWTASGATISATGGILTVNSTSVDPIIRRTVSFAGSRYPYVEVFLRRSTGVTWDGKLFYSTSGHGESGLFYNQYTEPTWDGVNYQYMIVDNRNLVAGGTDWTNNTITNLRLDFGAAATDDFTVDWIQIRGTIYPVAGFYQYSRAGYHGDNVNYLDTGATAVAATNSVVNSSVPEFVSYSYLGYFLAPTTGNYTFSLASDDRSWMWIGNDALAGAYTNANHIITTTFNTGTITSPTISMTAGTYYPIRIVYGNGASAGFGINLSFAGPGITSRTNGTGYFFYNADTTGI
jgi:GLEYA domain